MRIIIKGKRYRLREERLFGIVFAIFAWITHRIGADTVTVFLVWWTTLFLIP